MKSPLKRKLISGVGLLLVALVLIMGVALLSILRPLRLDLTEYHLYTLSDGTRHLLSNLEQQPVPLRLTLYFSDKVTKDAPALRTYAKRVKEMLKEYELQSHGHIKLTIIDPEPFSAAEDEAVTDGLQSAPGPNNEKIYFGLVGKSVLLDKASMQADAESQQHQKLEHQDVIPFFNPDKEETLEYDISQLIYRLQQVKTPVVGVISDLPLFQHRNLHSGQVEQPKIILDQVRQMFDVKRVYDNNIDKIDDDVDVLMVVHPHLWPEKTLFAIDQFVLRGGHLLVFMDPDAELDQSEAGLFGGEGFQDKSSSLEQLLTAWGVSYDSKKILTDIGFAHAIPVTRYGAALPHVGILGIRDQGLNREEAMTAHVDIVNIASAGVLDALPGATTHFVPLLQSSGQSQLITTENYHKAGNHEELLKHFSADGHAPYTIAAYVSGPAVTAFPNGKPVDPTPVIKNKNPASGKSAAANSHKQEISTTTAPLKQSVRDISVVLVADTDILDDRMWVQVQDYYGQRYAKAWASNSDFILNVLERLHGSADLIAVRSRGSYSRPFERVNKLERIASEKYSVQQGELQQKLKETEDRLMQLSGDDKRAMGLPAAQELTAEQQAELEKFQKERAAIRIKLREVRHQLNHDIEALGSKLKFINILAVPMVLAFGMLVMAGLRYLRRRDRTQH